MTQTSAPDTTTIITIRLTSARSWMTSCSLFEVYFFSSGRNKYPPNLAIYSSKVIFVKVFINATVIISNWIMFNAIEFNWIIVHCK